MNILHAASGWFQSHSIVTSVLIGFVYFLLSLFASDIRLFILHWPKQTLRSLTVERLLERKQLLTRLHGNAFEFLVYLTHRICLVTSSLILFIGCMVLIHKLLYGPFPSLRSPIVNNYYDMWLTLGAVTCGRMGSVVVLMHQLRDYEHWMRRIEDKLNATTGRLVNEKPTDSRDALG